MEFQSIIRFSQKSYMKFQIITLRRANKANEENYDNRKTIRGSNGNI